MAFLQLSEGNYSGETDNPSVSLSLDFTDDIELDAALFYVDADTGKVYSRDPLEGTDDDAETWTDQGKMFPPGDGSAPSQVTDVVVTPLNVTQPDGSSVPGFSVSWSAVPEADVIQYEVQYDVSPATFATPVVRMAGTGVLSVIVEGITGNIDYDFRVRALDVDAMPGAWSATVTATAPKDGVAPDMPSSVEAIPGFRMVGVAWSRSESNDLAFYQVRYYLDSTPESFNTVNVRSNRLIIDGLIAEQSYGFQVRAVDRSGNVVTSDVDSTAVDYITNPEAGWTAEVLATPSLVGAADLSVGTLVANFISTGVLDASVITSGSLTLGGEGSPVSLTIMDSLNNQMAEWNDDGLVIWDPAATAHAVWLYGGSVKFSEDYDPDTGPNAATWSTAIDWRGVNAAAILFGSDVGGHNRVPNAGMESAPFPTAAPTSFVWTVTTDWDDADAGTKVNLKVSETSLQMTGV
jgi:hypothetical protein